MTVIELKRMRSLIVTILITFGFTCLGRGDPEGNYRAGESRFDLVPGRCCTGALAGIEEERQPKRVS